MKILPPVRRQSPVTCAVLHGMNISPCKAGVWGGAGTRLPAPAYNGTSLGLRPDSAMFCLSKVRWLLSSDSLMCVGLFAIQKLLRLHPVAAPPSGPQFHMPRNDWHHKDVCAQLLSWVWLFVTPGAVAHWTPLSVRFPKQEYWSGFSLSSPADLPNPGIEPRSPALQVDSF